MTGPTSCGGFSEDDIRKFLEEQRKEEERKKAEEEARKKAEERRKKLEEMRKKREEEARKKAEQERKSTERKKQEKGKTLEDILRDYGVNFPKILDKEKGNKYAPIILDYPFNGILSYNDTKKISNFKDKKINSENILGNNLPFIAKEIILKKEFKDKKYQGMLFDILFSHEEYADFIYKKQDDEEPGVAGAAVVARQYRDKKDDDKQGAIGGMLMPLTLSAGGRL